MIGARVQCKDTSSVELRIITDEVLNADEHRNAKSKKVQLSKIPATKLHTTFTLVHLYHLPYHSSMRSVVVAVVVMALSASAFVPSLSSPRLVSTAVDGYVPSGFTPEQWKKYQAEEKKKKATKNLGGLGPRGFKSRSFQSFQEALERGEAEHLLPVMNAKERVRKGEIKLEDIPYMQRGGSWDNSDVKGAKKARWLKSDREYADGGYKKEQSVSIFGYGEGLDWTGTRGRRGPPESAVGAAPKFGRNYKAPNIKDMKKDDDKPKKKGFFGLF